MQSGLQELEGLVGKETHAPCRVVEGCCPVWWRGVALLASAYGLGTAGEAVAQPQLWLMHTGPLLGGLEPA